jgi:hypothetical protein
MKTVNEIVTAYLNREIDKTEAANAIKALKSPKTLTQINTYLGYINSGTYDREEFITAVAIPLPPVEPPPVTPPPVEPPPVTPPPATLPLVKILRVEPNDDSAKVHFEHVEGAVDYRIYPTGHAHAKKYSGGNTIVEWNGIRAATEVVVEAVDQLGPFQFHDGSIPHSEVHSINGHGPSTNQPKVIARSAPFTITPEPHAFRTLPNVIFFDDYRDGSKYTKHPLEITDPRTGQMSLQYVRFTDSNGTWEPIQGFDVDAKFTNIFADHDHVMDIIRDGGTEGSNVPPRVSYGGLYFETSRTADLTGGKIVHFTHEVDAHFPTGRRWWSVIVHSPGDWILHPKQTPWDPNYHPSKEQKPVLWWQISTAHSLALYDRTFPKGNVPITRQEHGAGPDSFNWCQRSGVWAPVDPVTGRNPNGERFTSQGGQWLGNGEPTIDLRRRFDIYLSKERVQIWEDGHLCRDARIELNLDQVVFALEHGMYHSALEEQEIKDYAPHQQYYRNFAKDFDERHWDNVGARYVDAFPQPDDPKNSGITWPN